MRHPLMPGIVLAALAAACTGAPLPALRHPVAVLCHRGGAGISPENTLAAYRRAIELKADYVEIDVRTTRDGHLVIMHDSKVDRTTNGKGAIRDLTLAQIRRLDAGGRFGARYAGAKVPTLAEVLSLCRGRINIYLDHKDADTAQVLRALQATDMTDQVVIYAGPERLNEWKRLAPNIPVMPSLPDEYRRTGGVAEFLRLCEAEVLDGHLLEWTPELVKQAHEAGCKVYVDIMGPTENAAGYRRALEMGVDGIQTDVPDRLIEWLKPTPAPKRPAAKLIEFGWDEPDTQFMRKQMAQMERMPFDGTVFHVAATGPQAKRASLTWDGWSKRTFTTDELRGPEDDLRTLRPTRMRSNYLRFNTTPADIDWFDDHSAVINNAYQAARLARIGRCPGVLFDIEQYLHPLFKYPGQKRSAEKSFAEYSAQVRKRGYEVMDAFQRAYPNLTVFLTYGYSLPWAQCGGDPARLATADYGLLAPFLDGMVDAAKGSTRMIEGGESGYWMQSAERFGEARRTYLRDALTIVADPRKYLRHVSISFGLWLDFDWRNQGWSDTEISKNHHSPEGFAALLMAARRQADDVVWIYTETPKWWTAAGRPDKLPDAYTSAVRRAWSH